MAEFRWKKPANLETVVVDFKVGLESEKDGTVDVITSELALGHYGSGWKDYKEHSLETFEAAHRKLRVGGKLMLVVDSLMRDDIKRDLIKAGFASHKITARRLTEVESSGLIGQEAIRTFCTK